MKIPDAEDKVRVRKEKAKKAIALAMQNRWEDAVSLNRSILKDFSDDLEAYNRLGKALSELGRNREATEAFQSALQISPTNSIARKNLERLSRLGDEAPRSSVNNTAPPQVFIEESGKTGVTSLLKLALPIVLLRLAPGHAVRLKLEGTKLMVTDSSSEHVGQVEPKLASRLEKAHDRRQQVRGCNHQCRRARANYNHSRGVQTPFTDGNRIFPFALCCRLSRVSAQHRDGIRR